MVTTTWALLLQTCLQTPNIIRDSTGLGISINLSIELHPRKRKKEKNSAVESEDLVVAPPRAFSSSGYSLANMTECVVDVDPYESTFL